MYVNELMHPPLRLVKRAVAVRCQDKVGEIGGKDILPRKRASVLDFVLT